MIDVIKRDGRREAFDEEKVRGSIEASARQAGIPNRRVRRLVDYVSMELFDLSTVRDVVESRDIREMILARLDIIEPLVSDAWRDFDDKRDENRRSGNETATSQVFGLDN